MIKSKEYLKDIQIVCRNEQDVENCLNMLEELGFEVKNNDNKYKVIYYSYYDSMFENNIRLECEKDTYFFNEKFIKILKKLINEKEEKKKEKKEKIEDIEVASDGRIVKINNKKSEKKIFAVYEYICYNGGDIICLLKQEYIDFVLKYGIAYETKEAKDKALFKIEIETKLKNIAERLNYGMKIDWDKGGQCKYFICYDFEDYGLCQNCDTKEKYMGQIYCLNIYFLEVAKKEIGEENLIKYFKD